MTDKIQKKRKSTANSRKIRDIDKCPAGVGNEANDDVKRGSQSSQGSTDSNHSSHVRHFRIIAENILFILHKIAATFDDAKSACEKCEPPKLHHNFGGSHFFDAILLLNES